MDAFGLRAELERRRDAYQKIGALVSGAAFCDEVIELLELPAMMEAASVENARPNIVKLSAEERGAGSRERFWIGASEARLSVSELASELGRPKSWIYRHTTLGAECRLPFKKLGGELVFVRGEVRSWVKAMEVTVVPATLSKSQSTGARRTPPERRTTTAVTLT